METSQDFPRRAEQVPVVRGFVRRTLAGWGLNSLDDVVLMASELFSNAVLHGAGRVVVRLRCDDRRVRLEVSDEGTAKFPRLVPEQQQYDTLTGRGLRIVQRLANTWGTRQDPKHGTAVWVEVMI